MDYPSHEYVKAHVILDYNYTKETNTRFLATEEKISV